MSTSTKTIHPSFGRLLDAAMQRGIQNSSGLASVLNESAQTITNWSTRGVSKAGALNAQERLGCSATWVLTGQGAEWMLNALEKAAMPPLIGATSAPTLQEALRTIASAAAAMGAAERISASGLIKELVMDPAANADDLIPIIARRLS